jgi:hypothetical protein
MWSWRIYRAFCLGFRFNIKEVEKIETNIDVHGRAEDHRA